MIATAVDEKLVTGAELLEMGDIGPAELIDGRITATSPTAKKHGALENRIAHVINQFVYPRKLGEVMVGEVGIYIRRNPDRIRAADVIFVSQERFDQDTDPGYLSVTPELVIEIVSPNDRWEQVRVKIEDYFAIGVERLWVVEPEQKDILVFRSVTESATFGMGDILKGEGLLEGLVISVSEIFEPR